MDTLDTSDAPDTSAYGDDDAPEDPYAQHEPPASMFSDTDFDDSDDCWADIAQPPQQCGVPDVNPDPMAVDWAAEVTSTFYDCIAAHHRRRGGELLEMFDFALTTPLAMTHIASGQAATWKRARQVAASAWADFPDEDVDLTAVPAVGYASGAVQKFFTTVATLASTPALLPANPTAAWTALADRLQRVAAQQSAVMLLDALAQDAPDDQVMDVFRSLVPPAHSKTVQNQVFAQSAADWEADDRAAAATSPHYRLSSGYPSLDLALTKKTAEGTAAEPFATFDPGSFTVIAAPTGNGKSSLARRLVPAMAQDLCNWGQPLNKVLVCITEESPDVVYTAAGLATGQPMHHLAKQVFIARVASSRARVVHAVWDRVIDAFHTSRAAGVPLAQAGLPAAIVWDYIGGTYEAGESIDSVGMERNANLAKAFMEWDVTSMEAVTGQSFAAYAGMTWPAGMEHFRPVVIAFAQFKKLDDPLWYDPNNKSCHLSDFVEDKADGSPAWTVLPGDFRMPKQSEVRGSGILINHATTLIIAQRSRPQRNPARLDPQSGRWRLEDVRARFLLVKTRTGADASVVPMAFDVQPSGTRAQFFDAAAESAIAAGKLSPTETYTDAGDPILPHRPTRSRLFSVGY